MKLYTPNTGDYNLVMAYPSKEEFALSSLGYLWLYKIADTFDGINVLGVSTDKNNINKSDTDAAAFSISYDFDFMGVLSILKNADIPFTAKERTEEEPIIFAGGPVITTNPLPYQDFFDFMIMGDGEETFPKVLECLCQKYSKKETIEKLSEIEGIYIPNKTAKIAHSELKEVIYTPILSENSYFKNTFIIEIARGCMNRCAFCTASYLNWPYRYYDYDKIIQTIDFGLNYTDKIALLGAQVSSHPRFYDILNFINNIMDNGRTIELGISSLRVDAISPMLVKTLVKGGQKNSTIAIEAASERLRRFINKNITEEQILNAIQVSKENGLKGLKIYSMIGIPTETDDDINEFIRLAKTIKTQNKGFNLEFSFSSFVPKPQTPFQFQRREDTKSIENKQNYLRKNLAKIGIPSKFSSAKWDYWQTVLSRGDETLNPMLTEVFNNGGNLSSYKKASLKYNIDLDKFINETDYLNNKLYKNISSNISKDNLINEYKRLAKKV